MEATSSSYGGSTVEEQRAQFTRDVHSAFNILRSRGMEPNEACALALKVAAGVAELPPTPDELARRLREDASAPLGQLCALVTRFFANGDCLHAAFWPQKHTPPQPSTGPAGGAIPLSPTPPSTERSPHSGSFRTRNNNTGAPHTTTTATSTSSTSHATGTTATPPSPTTRSSRSLVPSSSSNSRTSFNTRTPHPTNTATSTNNTASSSNNTSANKNRTSSSKTTINNSGTTTNTTTTATTTSSTDCSTPPYATCPLDFTAVAALYDSVLGFRTTTAPPGSTPTTTTLTILQPPDGDPPPPPSPPSPPSLPAISSSPTSQPRAASTAITTTNPTTTSTTTRPSTSSFTFPPDTLTTPTSTPPSTLSPLPPPTTAPRPAGHCAALGGALATGVEGLLVALSVLPQSVNPGLARQLGVMLANPLLDRGEYHDLLSTLVSFIGALSPPQRTSLLELIVTYPADELRRLLSRLQSFISLTLFRMQSITRGVEDATRLVALLHEANEETGRRAAAAAAAAAGGGEGAGWGAGSSGSSGCGWGDASMGLGGWGAEGYGYGAAAALEWGMGVGGLSSSMGFFGGSGGRGGVGGGRGGGAGWRPLEPAAFYNEAINHEDFNLKEDFRKWKHPHKYDFCFCKFPFMYDPGSKARILQMENQMSQVNELHSALFRGLFGGGGPLSGIMPDMCPFLVLRVRRGPYLVQDTLIQIHRAKETDSLKKPLKVKFIGEEGVDEGGVAKEFFQLLVRQLFNPDYGMFTADPTSHLHWFRPSRLELELEFELVGILIGLAIYNSHILEFQFPSVLYKKLVGACVRRTEGGPGVGGGEAAAAAGGGSGAAGEAGTGAEGAAAGTADSGTNGEGGGGGAGSGGSGTAGGRLRASGGAPPPPPLPQQQQQQPGGAAGASPQPPSVGSGGGGGALGLEDLMELAPEVASSLRKLLGMSPDMVEQLGLVFQVDLEMGFGEVDHVDLVSGGEELPVTAANRHLYVELYVKHLLEDSIAPQFGPFRSGFLRLCSGSALSWFSPAELELLVCGSRRLQLSELEGATQYDDGYTKESEPIKWFWEVVHALPQEAQKRLLFFVTGSDRVPIKGLAHLNPPFVISRAGAHSDRLPSAHTCFNHLLLPHYNSKEVLKERLDLALQNAEGFGLM